MQNMLTLVIPTHNRAPVLAALLAYLKSTGSEWRVLVLDSSHPDIMAVNRANASQSGLNIELLDLTAADTIVEKWRLGIRNVQTPYCLICADDDLILVEGVRHCLELMEQERSASVVQGYSFSFLPLPDGNMELNNVAYFTPSITQPTPLERVAQQFQQYQATVYGLYRTPVLQHIMEDISGLTAILSRELLWSALSVVQGAVIRVPIFTNGRSMGPSQDYEHWHPLEWLSKSPEGLTREYQNYRRLLTDATLKHPENTGDAAHVERILDLIHLRYLVKHAPDSALGFITNQQFERVSFKEYWPDHKIHIPLYEAAGIGARDQSKEVLKPVKVSGRDRTYTVLPNFYAALGTEGLTFESVAKLIAQLDNYKLALDGATAAEPAKATA